MNSQTPGVEKIFWKVIETETRGFTLELPDATTILVQIPEKMWHMMQWVQTWAYLAIQHTFSWPKSIAVYPNQDA